MTAELPHPIGSGSLTGIAGEHTGDPPARQVSIVPVRGLPIVAIALAGLVVVIARDSFWGLVFYHVVGGALWTSIDLFVGLVVGPIIGSMSIPSRAEFTAKFMPAMVIIMPTVVA